jgi:hypothetical protein
VSWALATAAEAKTALRMDVAFILLVTRGDLGVGQMNE